MYFFVNILSEAQPILECSFPTLESARSFYDTIITSGYNLSQDKFEISLGCYKPNIEEEQIYETQVFEEAVHPNMAEVHDKLPSETEFCKNSLFIDKENICLN